MNEGPVALAQKGLAAQTATAPAALAEPWLTASFCDPAYVVQKHHRVMSTQIKRWATTPSGRLSLSAPPRTGKSWLSIVWTTFWLLARKPAAEIIIACCTDKLVTQHGEDIRDRLNSYGHLFGLAIKRGSNRKDEFTLETGGHVLLVGIGSTTTGFGAHQFLIDDPFPDWASAASPTQRESKWMWATSVARSRLYAGGQLLHSATRWNEDDLEGRFKKRMPDRWSHIRIPAIADGPDDPLGRSIGEPMAVPDLAESDRAALVAHWQGIKEEQPPVVWQALYQGRPTPPGTALIDPDVLQDREHLSANVRALRTAVAIDPSVGRRTANSSKGPGNQDACGIMAGFLGEDQRVYLTHDITGYMKIEEWARAGMILAHQVGAGVVFVEANQGGAAWEVMLRGTWTSLLKRGEVTGPCPRVVSHHAAMPKEVRAEMFAGYIETDRVRTAAHLSDFYTEMLTWRPGLESPGRIDAGGDLAFQLLPDGDATGFFDGDLVAAAVTPTVSDVNLPDYNDED